MAREVLISDVTLDDIVVIEGRQEQVLGLRKAGPHTIILSTATQEVAVDTLEGVLCLTRLDEAKLDAATERLRNLELNAYVEDAIADALAGWFPDSAIAGGHAKVVLDSLTNEVEAP